jgi:DNA-binding NarL/FixJ family response regulator
MCDILLVEDIKLSDENGLNLTKKIKATYPDTVIIIFTNYNLPEYQDAAQKAGASHFLTKSLTNALQISELIESILSPIKRDRGNYPEK